MNRTATIAALAGLSLSMTAGAQAQPNSAPLTDPAKQPASSTPAKPRGVKPTIVDLQDAAKQPRKRTPRPAAATPPAPTPLVTPAPAPAVTPAAEPTPAPSAPAKVNEPLTPIATEPSTPHPAPLQQDTVPAAAPIAVAPAPTMPATVTPEPAPAPTAAITTPSHEATPSAAPTGVAVDIESVAVKPAKGELRRSPIDLAPEETKRSARQPVPAQPTEPAAVPAEIAAGPAQNEPSAPKTVTHDQGVPNPALSLLPPPKAQTVLSQSFVEKWAADRNPSVPVTTASKDVPAAPQVAIVEQAPAVSTPVPAPVDTHVPTPAPTMPIAAKPVEEPVAHPTAATPAPIASTPSVTEPVATPVAPAPTVSEPVAAPVVAKQPEPQAVKPVDVPSPSSTEPAARPLDVTPASEPLPPVPAPTAAKPEPEHRPIETKVEPSRPVEVKGPEVSPINLSNVKLPAAAATSTPNASKVAAAPEPSTPITAPAPAPTVTAETPAAPAVPAPSPTTTADTAAKPQPTPTAPAPTPAVATTTGSPEPVALKVLSLTGTPGMVQWQVDGGTQWLIPELDETTRARFTVRTGPDAGVEFLADESARVRLGRFSRVELRTIETTDSAGSGKRLNVSLLRGVVYIVPAKGRTVTVQTPQRTLVVKEPTQVSHDNGGTRSVSFADQPNSGTTAGVPSANP